MRSFSVIPLLALVLAGPHLDDPERVHINDNRRPAGVLEHGVLILRLDARLGTWYPDGDDAPGGVVEALAEAGHQPQIPGPLIRVQAGTTVTLSLHNAIAGATLIVHGLGPHPSPVPDTLQIAPGETRSIRFRLDAPGTYAYWGTTTGSALDRRIREDAQLSGAIVVDPPGAVPTDRVFVIGMWADSLIRSSRELLVINGSSWPHTERLGYTVGDTIRWRVLNLSAENHPMHLHGFYYRLERRGDGNGDTTYAAGQGALEVTERMIVGETMVMTWVADRAGNWLFHCHVPRHIMARGSLGASLTLDPSRVGADTAMMGMNGLAVGVTIRRRNGLAAQSPVTPPSPHRRLRLLVRETGGTSAGQRFYEYALQEGSTEPPLDSGYRQGPPIVLTRGEPVAITIVNRTREPTSVHWHGIELESYFDGLPGWSGDSTRIEPPIAPGDSFEARFTPPRAGTFIYHTHMNEMHQERAGLAGALLVLNPGVRWDPATDVVMLITTATNADPFGVSRSMLLNGDPAPPPREWRQGVTYRIRFIGMRVGPPTTRLELWRDSSLAEWRVVAKDGAELPPRAQVTTPARGFVATGETEDVEVTPRSPGQLRLEARATGGIAVQLIRVRK